MARSIKRKSRKRAPSRPAKVVRVSCSHCCGTGTVALTDAYLETYEFLMKQKKPVGSSAVADALKVSQSAAINRLQYLKGRGLVKVSDEDGLRHVYQAVSAK